MTRSTPVAIVGGGLVGSSLALALARAGIACTLIEARVATLALADARRERYLALARGSVVALQQLGVWAGLAEHAAAIRGVHVSRRGDFGRLLLRAEDHGVDAFGAVVPASRLGQALHVALDAQASITRVAARATGLAGDVDAARLALLGEGGADLALTAPVVVAADGADSTLRGLAGIDVEREDYDQDALVLSAGLGRDHAGIACERFTDDGAIAVLPLPLRRAGLVWTLARARAEAIAAGSPESVLAALQADFGLRLGRFADPGQVIRYPLQRSRARSLASGRVVLVGNAAQSLHPVAAQGFNLGLRDALTLAEELATAFAGEVSMQSVDDALRRHAARRAPDRERIAALSHALARWPKRTLALASPLRSAALAVLNLSREAQSSLALAAMGFGDDAPALTLAA